MAITTASSGRIRSAHGWTVGSVRRLLENTKYRGHWVWNKSGTCRDRRTGCRRYFLKPGRLLGRMVLDPVHPDQGNPCYVARTAIDVLVLLESRGSDPGSDPGPSSFGWWRRRPPYSYRLEASDSIHDSP
ncbi:MAG: recombinase family protein [Acidobacteria bacterium]|nr:recombinase family protein [Acidobacteriota bacterium]